MLFTGHGDAGYTSVIGGPSLLKCDTRLEAQLHLARTAIRRAERRVVALQQNDGIANPLILPYLNRLSSWVYGLALMVGAVATPQ